MRPAVFVQTKQSCVYETKREEVKELIEIFTPVEQKEKNFAFSFSKVGSGTTTRNKIS